MLDNSQQINLRSQEKALFEDISTLVSLKDGVKRATGEHSATFTRLLNHLASKDNPTYNLSEYKQNSEFISSPRDKKLQKLLGKDYAKKVGTVEIQEKMYKFLSGAQSTFLPRLITPVITNNFYPKVRETEVSGDNKLLLKGGIAFATISLLKSDPTIQEELINKYSTSLSNLSTRKSEAPKMEIGEKAIIIDYRRDASSLGYVVEKMQNGFKFKNTFYVSASSKGTGFEKESKKTPTGSFAILPRYKGTVIISKLNKSIRPNTKKGYENGSSLFTTAKLALSGLDKENFNTMDRAILLHGTPKENTRFSLQSSLNGSSGCLTLTNQDMFIVASIIEKQLNDQKEGNRTQAFRVEITETKPDQS